MKARSFAVSVLVVAAAFASAQALSEHSRPYWARQYNGIANMFATKNMNAFVATLDPKFVYIDDKGKKHTRDEFIQIEVEPIKQATSVGGTVKVTNIHVKGDTVAVEDDWRYTVVVKGSNRQVGDKGEELRPAPRPSRSHSPLPQDHLHYPCPPSRPPRRRPTDSRPPRSGPRHVLTAGR